MRTIPALVLTLGVSIGVAGCGGGVDSATTEGAGASSSSGAGGGTTAGSGNAASSGAGGSSAGNWTTLMTGDWTLAPGSEKTSDVHTLTLTRDIYVGAIRPIEPVGTHHTVLALNGIGAGGIIYASGVGTNALEFPPGVGLKLPAGETLILQLHLFNTSAQMLAGTSGIEIIEVDPADIQDEADLFLPGPMTFAIPPNQTYTHSGTCTVNAPQNLFAVFPHMHQLGTHLKTTLTIGGTDQVLHDGDYAFDHQAFIPFPSIAMQPNDTIKTECTWTNTTGQTVTWGESSTTEMCFSIMYRYPAQSDGGPGICSN
jgi:hypothetical protein